MLPLLVTLLVGQVDAGPADAGSPPATCGSAIDVDGACFGPLAAWCSEDNAGGGAAGAAVLVEDCGAGSCAPIDELGAWCFAPAGARCAFAAGERATSHACGPAQPIPDPAWGCDLVEGCVPLTVAGCGEGCADGERLRVACAPFGQALLFPCAAFGGTCAEQGCSGLGAGAPCDARLACATGLACVEGTCALESPGVAVDAGPGDPAPANAPPPWCGTGAGAGALCLTCLLAARRCRRAPTP